MTVLFIDDDPEDIQLFCEILEEILPEVTCNSITRCTDLKSDLAAFEPADVILLDAHMTPITSQECLQQLKGLVDPNKTKIIIHTGSISETEATHFLGNGATAIVYKAADFAAIKANLTRAIIGKSA